MKKIQKISTSTSRSIYPLNKASFGQMPTAVPKILHAPGSSSLRTSNLANINYSLAKVNRLLVHKSEFEGMYRQYSTARGRICGWAGGSNKDPLNRASIENSPIAATSTYSSHVSSSSQIRSRQHFSWKNPGKKHKNLPGKLSTEEAPSRRITFGRETDERMKTREKWRTHNLPNR